jgi:hypothetical protein
VAGKEAPGGIGTRGDDRCYFAAHDRTGGILLSTGLVMP